MPAFLKGRQFKIMEKMATKGSQKESRVYLLGKYGLQVQTEAQVFLAKPSTSMETKVQPGI